MGAKTAEKKRKAAPSTASPSAKKTKKDEVKSKKAAAVGTESPKPTKPAKASVLPTVDTGKKDKVARKRAADFMGDESDEEAGWAGFEDKTAKKGSKKVKKANGESAVKEKKKGKKEVVVREPSPEEEQEIALAAEESEEDQSSTLLKGFESSDDESDNDGPEEKGLGDMSKKGLPDSEKTKKKLKEAKKTDQPGVVLLSRIPHGFYEHEMKSYFTQFGDVTRLRLSRNKKTGRSKHYAFIEFASSEVAEIVAETMDNYLLFNHILKCKMIKEISPEDKERLFIGANKRFKAMPRAKMERRIHDKQRTEEEWKKREAKENARRKEKAEKLKALGIDYEFEVAKPVPQAEAGEETAEETVAEEEAAPIVEEPTPKKKAKKVKAIKATEEKTEDKALEAEVKKTLKEKKPKAAAEKVKKAVPVAADKKKKKSAK